MRKRDKVFPEIGRERLVELFAYDQKKITDSMTRYDIYFIPSLFFCHLYEVMGPKKMMEFYGLISGNKKYTLGGTVRDDAKGDLVRALNVVAAGDKWRDADMVIDGFIRRLK